jgi:outer membrane protein assembly factor BamB
MTTQSLRLWPGVTAVVLQWILWLVVPRVLPDGGPIGLIGGLALGLVVLVWWLFFSRARWSERIIAIAALIAVAFATWPFLHVSIQNGYMGRMFPIFVVPGLSLALVAWAVVSRGLTDMPRRAMLVGIAAVACSAYLLIRTDGITGEGDSQLRWRWTKSHEELLLAASPAPAPVPEPRVAPPPPEKVPTATGTSSPASPAATTAASASNKPTAPASAPAVAPATSEATKPADASVAMPAVWPGFRGPRRDGIIRAVSIATDWTRTPPVEIWRRPIGPGWSSFAVSGDHVYTQEQRGEDEIVSCYRLSNGEPVWTHRDPARFWESNGGAGPRGTPSVHNGRVYALGATGIVNALDARSGKVIWSRNAATDTGAPLPGWGFTSSPLIVDDVVVVATSGRLAGYDVANGNLRWTKPTGGGGYSSPHPITVGGVPQVVLLSASGATAVSPADGAVLWQHKWEGAGVAIVQPALVTADDLIVTAGDAMGGFGLRRINVAHAGDSWTAQERWTSRGLKPYFNDYVVHEGHVYGFDGSILSCIELASGERKWKGGRYGHGQLVLLADQDVMLVLSEEGELALVSATPDAHKELARFKAIEGKTWNHPVLAGDVLLVRNGEEMAAFRLTLAGK